MDPFTISMILSAIGGGISLIGQAKQGEYERAQAELATQRNAEQIGWQQDILGNQSEDLERDKRGSVGTLLTNTAAMGVGGPLVSAAKGSMIGEYNRALSRIDTQSKQLDIQKGWGAADLNTFEDQSKWNQGMAMTNTLLTTGANMGFSMYQNSFNKAPSNTGVKRGSDAYYSLMGSNIKQSGGIGR